MSDEGNLARSMIERQIKELDGIWKQATQDLNTVAGQERVAKWKAKTVGLIAQHIGQKESQEFARKHPGPSFTNDLVEEFGEDIEYYRAQMEALNKGLSA